MNSNKTARPLTAWILSCLASFAVATSARAAEPTSTEYLSDRPELILSASQAWGEPGWNVAAHASGQAGLPLQIGDKTYAKGLGHHANGAIAVLLDGEYASFDAEVGLQPCGGGGSVTFRLLVDGQQRFDSGILRATNAPKPVHLNLAGAQELRLEANDAGDGITCDMANWVNARLTRASVPIHAVAESMVNIARFARVVSWDPNRLDGARASRIEEFRAEDLFPGTELPPRADGSYAVPTSANGLACIGLQWLNRRALKELALEFPDASQLPAANSAQVQGWVGESAWQGNWQSLAGEMQATGNRLVFRFSPNAGLVQTRKIRWVFPAAGKPLVQSLSAFTRSRWQTVNLYIEAEKPAKGTRGDLVIFNGELLDGSRPKKALTGASHTRTVKPETVKCDLTRPLHLSLRSSRPSSFNSDPTILQFHLPAGSFGVAVEDVLSNGCVYLPDQGLFVAQDPTPFTLAEYKRKIAARKTILEQVRELPDQTLAQAMAKTHHAAQQEGPVMLSLACDNTKFVLERDGRLRFQATTNQSPDWFGTAGEMRPQFGTGQPGKLARALEGGWLPIPIITVENNGVLYRQRTFVAPADAPGKDPARLNRLSVCIAEFTLTNTQASAAPASLTLSFVASPRQKPPVVLPAEPSVSFSFGDRGVTGIIVPMTPAALRLQTKGDTATYTGTLPPHAEARISLFLADPRADLPSIPARAEHLRTEVESYWKAVLAPAMQVKTPDPLLNDIIRSSQVRCLIAARNEADGARIAPWIAAMSYGPLESEAHAVVRGMDFMGHEDFARRGLDFFIHRYNTNGFLTTGYTTFGTAWHLWTLGEHYQLHRDTSWLRQVAPEVTRVGEWIVRQTQKTKQAAAPESGLMPPGVLADWNAFAYHFAMNAYYYAALRDSGAALSDLAKSETGKERARTSDSSLNFTSAAADLRANILKAYRWTQSQAPALPLRNGTWIPHYPSQVHSPGKLAEFFPGQDAGRSWCYDVEIGAHQLVPTGVFAPHAPEVTRMMEHMEDAQFLSDGWFDYPAAMNEKDWFNLGGFSKVQPYYTRNCEVYALRDDVKPFIRSYFNTIAAMLNPEVLTFWEHFNHSGAWDKTHETGYFLHQTRTMLVMERGDQLWLAPFITGNWLKDGMTVAVTNAPTRFGPVSYTINSHLAQGFIEARILPPTRMPPKQIVLRLHHPDGKGIQSVAVDQKRIRQVDSQRECIIIKPARTAMSVRVQFDKGL